MNIEMLINNDDWKYYFLFFHNKSHIHVECDEQHNLLNSLSDMDLENTEPKDI